MGQVQTDEMLGENVYAVRHVDVESGVFSLV